MAEKNEKDRDFSEMPGPWGVPILGSMLTLGTAHASKLMDWGEKYYGNVFRYKIMNQNYVVLNGLESVKEGLLLNGTKLDGREAQLVTHRLFKEKGLFFTDYGHFHQRWKSFATRAFADVMKGMPGRICDQGEKFLLDITHAFENAEAIDIKNLLKQTLARIGLLNFLNKEYEEEDLQSIVDCVYSPFRSTATLATLYLATHEESYNSLRERLEKDVRHRVSSPSHPDDIVSAYINETPEPIDEDIKQLTGLLIDWIFAGTSTCAEQILWVVLLLLKHPEQLKLVKEELRSVIEKEEKFERLYQNRDLVPHLQASIQEAMRLRPIAPKSLPHKTMEEAVVGGFKIPKDVVVIPNIWSVHHDRKLWSPDPEEFKPERHLDEDGKFIPSEFVIPFGLGGRRCVGEQLARANIFILAAMLLSRCDFDLAPESKDVDMNGVVKSILQTPAFKVVKTPTES